MKYYLSLLLLSIVWFNSTLYVSNNENIPNLPGQSKNLFLLEDIYNSFDLLKKDPENPGYQQNALHTYNFFRELLKQQPAKSLKDIDKSWLAQQLYASWIEKKQEQWKAKNITTVPERAQDLLGDIDDFFTQRDDPNRTATKEENFRQRKYLLYEAYLTAEDIRKEPAGLPKGAQELIKTIDRLYYDSGTLLEEPDKPETTIDGKLIFYYHLLSELFKPYESYPQFGNFLSELSTLNRYLNDLKKDPESTAYRQETLYAYNFLRGLLKQQPVESFKDIDTSWLDKFRTTGDTFFSLLSQNKGEEALKIIREQNRFLLVDKRTDDWTPLLWIAGDTRMDTTKRLQLAQELLSRGADVHAQRKGLSVLGLASGVGGTSAALVEFLIAHGANEFEQAYYKAIHWSDRYKNNPEHSQIIKILRNKL